MTTFLLIRHGESMANAEKRFAGHLDIPLSPLGEQQAALTAAFIANTHHVDAVYASDLKRAFFTGKAVADTLGLPIFPDNQLREIAAGEWEGVIFDQLQVLFADSYRRWLTDIGNAGCDGGETVSQLQTRFLAALRRIAERHPFQTVVIATHATPIRVLQCHCEGKKLAEMHDIPWVSNASITTVTYEDGVFRAVATGEEAHLGTSGSKLPANV